MEDEKSQINIPVIQEIIRDNKGKFIPGVSGNPKGRPTGKTLKEYQAEKFRLMTDIEKEEFLKDVPKETRWKMSEGNPKQDTEIKGHLTISEVLDNLDGSEIEGQIVEIKPSLQNPEQGGEASPIQIESGADPLSPEQVEPKSDS